MKCVRCGTYMSSDSMYCTNCGAPASRQNGQRPNPPQKRATGGQTYKTAGGGRQKYQERRCRVCGNPLSSKARFCDICGTLQDDSKYPPDIKTDKEEKKKLTALQLAALISGAAAAAAVLVVVLFLIFDPFGWKGNRKNDNSNSDIIVVSPNPTQTPVSTDAAPPTIPASIATPTPPPPTVPPSTTKPKVPQTVKPTVKVTVKPTVPPTVKPTVKPTPTPTPKPTPTPTPKPTPQSAIPNPSYKRFSVSGYNFSCEYPTHFIESGSGGEVKYSSKSPDGTVTFKIIAQPNSGITPSQMYDTYVSRYAGGKIDMQNVKDDSMALSIIKDGIDHYSFFRFDDERICGYEFHSNASQESIYGPYIQHIHDTMSF